MLVIADPGIRFQGEGHHEGLLRSLRQCRHGKIRPTARLPRTWRVPCTSSASCPGQKPRKSSKGGRRRSERAQDRVKLIIFVGGTCGCLHVQTFNNNLKELGVVESKRNAIRKGFEHELLNAQDTILCSYFAQRSGTKGDGCGQKSNVEEIFQGLDRFE